MWKAADLQHIEKPVAQFLLASTTLSRATFAQVLEVGRAAHTGETPVLL
jgi:hypothetical protein